MGQKNILNIDADTGANIIGDEATPVLTISNSSTGPALEVNDLVVTSAATVNSSVAGEPALNINKTVVSTYSVATMGLGVASTASAPAIRLLGTAFVSATSIDFGDTAAVSGHGAIRVMNTDGDTMGWIPVIPDARVDAAVVE